MGLDGPLLTTWVQSLTKRENIKFPPGQWSRITHLVELFIRDPSAFVEYGHVMQEASAPTLAAGGLRG
jgi:hypothetical protein